MDLHLLAQFCWAVGDGGGPLIDRNGKLVGLYMPDTERTFNFLIPMLVTLLRSLLCLTPVSLFPFCDSLWVRQYVLPR